MGQAIVSLFSWMLISTWLIILNKQLLVDDGFNFPLALTATGQTISCLLGLLMAQFGVAKLGNFPSIHIFATQLLPVAGFAAGTLYYGNIAYLYLPVAFIQILKVATPLFTLLISATLGLESLSLLKCMSMLLILLGSGLATFIESNSASFSWFGFGLMLFSALLEAVKVVYIQKLFGKLNYSSVELMVYLGPPTAIFLGTASCILEGRGLIEYGFQCIRQNPYMYILAILGGFGVNLTTAYAIKATSSLTFKVWGCVKNTAVVVIGCLLGDSMDAWQMFGYILSTVGFTLYSWTKSHPQTKVGKKSSD